MTLSEYALRSLHLDRQLRASSRITAYGVQALRMAEIMALLTLLSDLTPWRVVAESPGQRISFIAFFSLAMAALNLVRDPGIEEQLDALDRPPHPERETR